MSEITLKTNKTIEDYCEGIKKLLLDIKEEIEKEMIDGIGMKLASQNSDEAQVYSFLKNEGYEFSYKDFSDFYNDSLSLIEDNEEAIGRMLEEQSTEELSDVDLEKVAGGGWFKNNWKSVAIGVGVALLVGAAVVATAGTAGVFAAGVAAGSVGMHAAAGAVATAQTCAYIAGGMAAGGVLGITAGTTE